MALIDCPECGREVSDKAPACIHCGYPLPSPERRTASENGGGETLNGDVSSVSVRVEDVERLRPWMWGRMTNFQSRTRRSEFWTALLVAFVGTNTAYFYAWDLAETAGRDLLVPLFALAGLALAIWLVGGSSVNRLHDMGYSGWLVLLLLVPFVGLALIVWIGATDGDPGPNKWGPPVA